MSTPFRPFTTHKSLQNYPKIQIDRGSVIKPCSANQTAADQFIYQHKSSWAKILKTTWNEGIPFLIQWISGLKVPANGRKHQIYIIKATKLLALILLYIHRIYLYIYGYLFPYSLMPVDTVCDEFSRCPKWSESVIRAFAWHPNFDRCAVAICNDYISVYQGSTRIRVLRHAQQRKITDLAWQPSNKEVLVVATQTHIVLWRVSEIPNGPLSYIRDNYLNPTYLAPGSQLILRKDATNDRLESNGFSKRTDHDNRYDSLLPAQQTDSRDFKILSNLLPAPIISIQFDNTGKKLYACSPNSSKIAVLQIDLIFSPTPADQEADHNGRRSVEYLVRFGQGITKLLWSPNSIRLAAATTATKMRVYEPSNWSYNHWSLSGNLVQDMVWTKPSGRMLLIANKTEPYLYALPFLDEPQPGDVGGNKSLMKALDLTATQTELGEFVGGRIQSLAWDKDGKRLAIAFQDNPESILLYRTCEKPTVEFHQLGIIQNDNRSTPLLMEFHDKFKGGSLLTICWSDGNCQHIPMIYSPSELTRNGLNKDGSFHDSFNQSYMTINSFNDPSSPPKTPRSLTNFCHVSGNNSISSFPASLLPINKVQHQTTLFSLSNHSILDDTRNSEGSND